MCSKKTRDNLLDEIREFLEFMESDEIINEGEAIVLLEQCKEKNFVDLELYHSTLKEKLDEIEEDLNEMDSAINIVNDLLTKRKEQNLSKEED